MGGVFTLRRKQGTGTFWDEHVPEACLLLLVVLLSSRELAFFPGPFPDLPGVNYISWGTRGHIKI